jgi:hypothetical protein
MELSKSDKKVARLLMDKGIEKELEICNNDIAEIIKEWNNQKVTIRETYSKIYETVQKNDKYIARNYDGITGVHYFNTVVVLFKQKLLSDEDINQFSEEVRTKIKKCSEL